jgi:RecA-family ATPase
VKDKSTLRRLIQSATEVLGRAYDAEASADALIADATDHLSALAATATAASLDPRVGHNLAAWLTTAPTAPTWRIAEWQPAESRVLLAAPAKRGKTTLVANVARALVDGDPFLGAYAVQPVTGTVALLDFEMSERQLWHWLHDQGFAHPERITVFPLRGQARLFDVRDPACRRRWADRLRAVATDYLVFDCLRPVLDALGLDEHRDVGAFLVAFDALLAEAGVRDALVVHHMGHTHERARGDSRLIDWPDVTWRLVGDRTEDGASIDAGHRYLDAYGRDVEVTQGRLTYDAPTRRLIWTGGTRAATTRDHAHAARFSRCCVRPASP